MRSHHADDSALDEFAAEEPNRAASGSLLDVAPANPPRDNPAKPFSRSEALLARRRSRRQASMRQFAALVAAAPARVRGMATSVATASRRAWAVRSRVAARTSAGPALEHQEANGSAVAVVLAVAVLGYGGLLAVSWRTPASEHVVSSASIAPVATGPVATEPPPPISVVTTTVDSRMFTPSARSLTALWQQGDTRSLEQAFATLRRQTLAFHRCGMRVTDVDRAVAQCEGVATMPARDGPPSSRPASWTIDFRRADGRWQIARVTKR